MADTTAHQNNEGVSSDFDISKPNVARVYDYLLGGKNNFAADREQVERVLAVISDLGVDAVAALHAASILATTSGVSALRADLTDPGTVLAAPQVRAMIETGKPIAVILAMVLHFYDAATANHVVTAYMDAVPSGSFLVISSGSATAEGEAAFTRTYHAGQFRNHSPEQVRRFFAGLEMVDPPGVVDASAWIAGQTVKPPAPDRGHILAGVAIKP
jgi:hypothetical protein